MADSKKRQLKTGAQVVANNLMSEIREADAIVADILRKKAEAVADIERRFAPELDKWTTEQTALISELRAHMEAYKHELFASAKLFGKTSKDLSEVVELPNGFIRYAVQTGVKRVRKMLATLKSIGRTDLIHTTETADWSKIEKLQDDQLAALGTTRVSREVFDYDVKQKP